MLSVSCGSAGSCAAGGYYTQTGGRSQGFVTSEDNGTWGTPVPLPGLAALNVGRPAEVGSVWCGPAGRQRGRHGKPGLCGGSHVRGP